jgi:hypothetical protein
LDYANLFLPKTALITVASSIIAMLLFLGFVMAFSTAIITYFTIKLLGGDSYVDFPMKEFVWGTFCRRSKASMTFNRFY